MNIILPPTQQYEIVRFSKFKNIEKLLDFAMKCKTEEVLRDLYLPVHKLNSFIDINYEANNH